VERVLRSVVECYEGLWSVVDGCRVVECYRVL